jgi:D-alanyl-D-alanine carboxypeptidase
MPSRPHSDGSDDADEPQPPGRKAAEVTVRVPAGRAAMFRLSKHLPFAHVVAALCVVLVSSAVASCASDEVSPGSTTPSTTSGSGTSTGVVTAESGGFPIAVFAGLSEEPVSAELAAQLQEVLDTAADGDGLTATVITPGGTWSGATGFAAGRRAMTPDVQMSIASITKTLVAAQVMQLVEAGKLSLDDPAADRLPAGVEFDTNGATIVDLLSMRSGFPESLDDDAEWELLTSDPLHVWTPEEVLATVAPERGPVGQAWEYRGVNYMLLGLIIEHVTGQPVAEVLRSGVLAGDEYERLISQPDERPTDPIAMPFGAPADTFDDVGRYLPSLAGVTAVEFDGGMASDSLSLARWWRGLCSGEVVSPAALDEMTDFVQRPGYGLGIMDRSSEYGSDSGALGHTGNFNGFTTAALCFRKQGIVVAVLANAEHDVDTVAGNLVQAASP